MHLLCLPWFWGMLKGRDHFSRNMFLTILYSRGAHGNLSLGHHLRAYSLMPLPLLDPFVDYFICPLLCPLFAKCLIPDPWSCGAFSFEVPSPPIQMLHPSGPVHLIFSTKCFWLLQLTRLFIFWTPNWYYVLTPNHVQSYDHPCLSLSGSVS